MYKLCLLMAYLACGGHGRRLKATLGSQDVQSGNLMQQLNSSAGSRSRGQADRSGSGPFSENMADPRKLVRILLTFFSPAVLAAESSGHDNIGVGGPTVRIVIGIDWEGLHLRRQNLFFFNAFREAHPDVPLTHFLNAAYFVESEFQSEHEWDVQDVLSPIDELGLHINGLRSLVEASGVQFRSEPNFLQRPETALQGVLMGYDVDVRAYSVDELQAIISESTRVLEKHGLKVGQSFRVGAWLAGPNVLEAFRRQNFRINSSAVGLDDAIEKLPSLQRAHWQVAPLPTILRELWPGVTKDSQPFLSETPAGRILEMPNTGGSASHATRSTTVGDIVEHIDSAIEQLDSEDRFVNIGLHQEQAATQGPILWEALNEIKHKHGHRVVFETLQASARRAGFTQRFKELETQIHLKRNMRKKLHSAGNVRSMTGYSSPRAL